jgi:hypothetical protein
MQDWSSCMGSLTSGTPRKFFHGIYLVYARYIPFPWICQGRLAAARTKDAVVALELAAGECGSGAQPGLAQGDGTTPCQIADNGRDPTLQFKYSID